MRTAPMLASLLCSVLGLLGSSAALAQEAPSLFAVQIRTGENWDTMKPPQEQLHFRAHSANLKRLRDAGQLIVGARYSDVGLIVLEASSEAQARAMMDEDPSFAAGIFRYELSPLNVFYPGTLN